MSHKIICLNCGTNHSVKDDCIGCLRLDVVKLKSENEKQKKAITPLTPYHGIDNPKGRLEAVQHSIKRIKVLLERFTHTAASDDCIKCQTSFLLETIQTMIEALKGIK